jgi:hypothetical protein
VVAGGQGGGRFTDWAGDPQLGRTGVRWAELPHASLPDLDILTARPALLAVSRAGRGWGCHVQEAAMRRPPWSAAGLEGSQAGLAQPPRSLPRPCMSCLPVAHAHPGTCCTPLNAGDHACCLQVRAVTHESGRDVIVSSLAVSYATGEGAAPALHARLAGDAEYQAAVQRHNDHDTTARMAAAAKAQEAVRPSNAFLEPSLGVRTALPTLGRC